MYLKYHHLNPFQLFRFTNHQLTIFLFPSKDDSQDFSESVNSFDYKQVIKISDDCIRRFFK